ncbi:MAG: efflux RND transporter periplasmic adaptor subunit [Persicimonas sp.]
MKETARNILRVALPLLVLLAAGGIAVLLLSTGDEAERAERPEQRVLVETVEVEADTHQLVVEAAGTVIAARDLTVQPQVSGRIVWVNDRLTPGGVLREGEALFRIDPSDYELAVEERQTALAQAQAQLAQERGRQEVAEREWELFEEEAAGADNGDPSLALRRPQLESAQVEIDAARARLERARLDLERTTVSAPFNAFVETESADVGQLVGTQTQVARLVGTDTFWVRLSVPVERVNQIDVPGVNASRGSPVTIEQDVGERTIERDGHVVRLLGDLDQAGRMAQVLVAIDDPFGLDDVANSERSASPRPDQPDPPPNDPPPGESLPREAPRGIPLLLNSYVDVSIEGPRVDGLIALPREALREGDQVWVYDDGTLDIREVTIAWSRTDTVFVREGLSDGDRLITSPIATPVPGMKLRTANGDSSDQPQPNGLDRDGPAGDNPADTGEEDVSD